MPAGDPHSKPLCRKEDALAVVGALRKAGHVAYFAGGCVRDLLLGLQPKDYDVATDAIPTKVRSLFAHTQSVGQAFGVILVRIGASVVEVATFRSDGKYSDGRRPDEVRFASPQEDAQRRDFTINGLFLDPESGQVIDFVGGRADLDARLLRAIGQADARFEEDHLRLLRAVRFAARFDLKIEEQTAQAIRRHAAQLAGVSPERIGEELRIMLTPPTRLRAWRELRETGLADVVFRFMPAPEAPSPPEFFDAVARGRPIPLGLSLAAAALERDRAAWPFDKQTVRKITRALRQSLRLSNDELEILSGSLGNLAALLIGQPGIADLKRFLAGSTSVYSHELLAALAGDRERTLQARLAELEKTDFAPVPFLTGEDLIAKGLKPGPVFKRILDEVYDAQLESRVQNKAEAIELAMRLSQEGKN